MIRIKKEQLKYFITILPFCFPEIFYFQIYFRSIIIIWKILVVFYAFFLGVKNISHINGATKYLLLMCTEIMVISFLNYNLPSEMLYIAAIIILFKIYLEEDAQSLLIVITHILETLIVVNLITVLLYPDGLYTTLGSTGREANWFLGYKNPMVRLMIPACVFSHAYSLLYNSKYTKWAWWMTIISFVTVVLVDSSTGILGIFTFSLISFMCNKKIGLSLIKKINLKKILFIIFLINFLILELRKQNFFVFIIETLLHRSADNLTGRTTIWDISVGIISENPWFGYGAASDSVMHSYIYASHPHNYILYLLIQGGIVALVLFVAMVIVSDKALAGVTSIEYKGIVLAGIISFWIMGIAESLTGAYFMYPLFILCTLPPKTKKNIL